MVAKNRLRRCRPTYAVAARYRAMTYAGRRRNWMHSQRRIAHQRDVDTPLKLVHLVAIHAAIVLAQTGAVTDRFAEAHVMIIPMRPACPRAGQAHARSGQRCAHDVVCAVPLAEPASEHHEEHRLGIATGNVTAPNVVVSVVGAESAHACVAAATATISPQVGSG